MEALEERMRRHERFQWIMFASLGVLAYLYYSELPRLEMKVVALREEVAKLNPDSDEDDLA